MDVSVVVPVYNTSRFLHQCIDSLINQTLRDVEFIFVDDGSTDNSVEILKQYQKKDKRITVLEQKNMYAGVARNNGMKQAKGKYIIFLDSDDYYDLTLLEKTFRCAEKNQAEIVFFSHYTHDIQTGKIRKCPFQMRRGTFSGESLGENIFSTFPVVPWNKLFLRSFLTKYNLEYQAIYKHNDVYFGCLSIALAKRIVCLNRCLVYYRVNNPESLQGKETTSYPYLIQCWTALKQSLIEYEIFHGCIKSAYNRRVSRSIEKRTRSKIEEMLSKQYYSEMKKNLVPNLFETPEDFVNDTIILNIIYESADYDHYVKLLYERMENRMISKKSKDYIIGHTLLAIPRIIKHAVFM